MSGRGLEKDFSHSGMTAHERRGKNELGDHHGAAITEPASLPGGVNEGLEPTGDGSGRSRAFAWPGPSNKMHINLKEGKAWGAAGVGHEPGPGSSPHRGSLGREPACPHPPLRPPHCCCGGEGTAKRESPRGGVASSSLNPGPTGGPTCAPTTGTSGEQGCREEGAWGQCSWASQQPPSCRYSAIRDLQRGHILSRGADPYTPCCGAEGNKKWVSKKKKKEIGFQTGNGETHFSVLYA